MAKKAEETTTKEEPQKVAGEESPSSSELTTEPVEPVVTEKKPVVEDKATEAFIQMRKEIRDLKKQLTERQVYSQPYNTPVPSQSYQATQATVDRNRFYNAETGEFDFAGYDQAIQNSITQGQAQQNAIAREIAQEEADYAAVKVAYPQIDRQSDEYSPEFDEAVAKEYYYSRYIQGKNISYSDAAKAILKKTSAETKKEEAKVEAEHTKAEIEKEVATGDTAGKTANTGRIQEQEEQKTEEEILSWKTRGVLPNVVGYDKNGIPVRSRVSDTESTEALVQRIKDRPWKKTTYEGT